MTWSEQAADLTLKPAAGDTGHRAECLDWKQDNLRRAYLPTGGSRMRMQTFITAFMLAGTAQAQTPAAERFDTMWQAYTNWCTIAVTDPNRLFANLDLIADGAALYFLPDETGDVYELKVSREIFSFTIHAGHVGEQTFMSCGVHANYDDIDAAGFDKIVSSSLSAKLPTENIRGGQVPQFEILPNNGGYETYLTEANYQYFADDAISGVDTLTFIQVVDQWLSVYFHHVFDGRVGLPSTIPQPIKRIP